MSFEVIRTRRENLSGYKTSILNSNNPFADKCVKAITTLPSQAYGILIKELVFNHVHSILNEIGDGYTEELGVFKVKVCVSKGHSAKLKQIIPSENIDTYVLVHIDYIGETVLMYGIPKDVIMQKLTTKPDHGNTYRGHSNEFTAFINVDDMEEYIIET